MTAIEQELPARKIARKAKEVAEKFSMRGLPLLSEGAESYRVLTSQNLDIGFKVYSGGGENDLHSHKDQDHSFFVLSGSARFFDEFDNTIDVGRLEGIMIPRSVEYRFESTGTDNLVMLRSSSTSEKYAELRNTHIGPDGAIREGKDPKIGGSRGKEAVKNGALFAPDGQFLS